MPKFYLSPDGNDAMGNWSGGFADVDDPFNSPDYATSFIANGNVESEARFTLSAMPSVSSINSVTVYIVVWGQSSTAEIRSLWRTGGTTYYDTYIAQTGSYGTQVVTRTINPNTGVAWTVSDLNSLIVGVQSKDSVGGDSEICTAIWVEVDAVALPAKLGAARHRGSTEIHLRRSVIPTINGRLGLLALDRDLLDQAAWMHYAGATVKDEGWGIKPWQRRLGALLSSDFDMDALEVTVRDMDLRRYLVSFRDTAHSEEVPSTQYQGVLRLDPGAGRVFARTTRAWIENPAAALQGLVQVVGISDGPE